MMIAEEQTEGKMNGGHAPGVVVLPLSSINRHMISTVGGKAANLGDMIQSKSLPVPPGFCVTIEGYKKFLDNAQKNNRSVTDLLNGLSGIDPNDLEAVRVAAEKLRSVLQSAPIPEDVAQLVTSEWEKLCAGDAAYIASKRPIAVAVRSSATAEDLPGASFAGQQDTYLNVVGAESVLEHVKKCWISLFTDRAVSYRGINGFDHASVYLCVVVQKQIDPVSAGIMFNADPLNGKRNVTLIEAGYGLGEALVSGIINADQYKINSKTREVIDVTIGDKAKEILPFVSDKHGGTRTVVVDDERRRSRVLNDDQISELVDLGARIQQHYGNTAQDIEWCVERRTGKFYVVQSRPITTLFPLPAQKMNDPSGLEVYASFGHLQVMTDPMPPCSRSVWCYLPPIGRDETGKYNGFKEAGAFMYGDITPLVRSPVSKMFLGVLKHMDERMACSIESVVERDEFRSRNKTGFWSSASFLASVLAFQATVMPKIMYRVLLEPNPENYPSAVLEDMDRHVALAKKRLSQESDPFRRLEHAIREVNLVGESIVRLIPNAMAGLVSTTLLKKIALGGAVSQSDFDDLGRGLLGNVTTDMDLEIGDLADVARKENIVCNWLKQGEDLSMQALKDLGAPATEFRAALDSFLRRFGCRGGSEIDVSRLRWADDPTPVLQVVRGNLAREETGGHRKHHRELVQLGEAAARRITDSSSLWKRPMVRRLTRCSRSYMACREHHKFLVIQILGELRRTILTVASILVSRGYLKSEDDVWMLTLEEIVAARDSTKEQVLALVKQRREEYEFCSKLKPPRVLTSEGECVDVQPKRFIPAGALGGIAASAGVVEGTAKVVLDPSKAVLHAGEILVAPFTDPGWTPLFINASGLIMEVGGLMTHGSVVAREYGIPAVICVDDATKKIKTGMRVRVDGSNGFVQIISDNESGKDIQ